MLPVSRVWLGVIMKMVEATIGACSQRRVASSLVEAEVAPRVGEGQNKSRKLFFRSVDATDDQSIHFAARSSCRIRGVSGLMVPSAGAKSFCILTLYRRNSTL